MSAISAAFRIVTNEGGKKARRREKTVNRFEIEDGSLTEYSYYYIPYEWFDTYDYRPYFKATYILEDGEIRVGTLSLIDAEDY
jgi:hypothetical protein